MIHKFIITVDTEDAIPASMTDKLADRCYGVMSAKGLKAEVTAEWRIGLEIRGETSAKLDAMSRET